MQPLSQKYYHISNPFLFPILIACLLFSSCQGVPLPEKTPNSIIIEADINKYFYQPLRDMFYVRNVIKIRYTPFQYYSIEPPTEYVAANVIDDKKVTWIINSDKPIKVTPPFGKALLLKPGDSVHISYQAEQPNYSGGNIASLELLNELTLQTDRLVKPLKRNSFNVTTLEDYLEWNDHLNKELATQLPIFDSYQKVIPATDFIFYKANVIGKIEHDRVRAFNALSDSVMKGYPGLSFADLAQIWDTTQYKPSRRWLQSLPEYYSSLYDYFSFVQTEVIVKQFNFSLDSLRNHEVLSQSIYTNAKNNYKGLIRERLLAYIVDEQSMTEIGLKNPTTQALLKDYYNLPGFPEYKKYVKEQEKKRQERELEKEKQAKKKKPA